MIRVPKSESANVSLRIEVMALSFANFYLSELVVSLGVPSESVILKWT